jgi:hypothetical protein
MASPPAVAPDASRAGQARSRRRLDIDRPAYRDRLWSWTDSQIVYYATHFHESRARKRALVARAFGAE